MTWFMIAVVVVVAAAGLLRWRRPAWYWLTFGVLVATVRVLVRYASVMDACGLTVPPSRWRLALARMANRPVPESRAPRILRLRPTRTGLVLRLKLRPGQDAFDVAASTDRLRHSFGIYRDYRAVPHGLTLGATESGKSVYQRNLVAGLAPMDVALVGIDCKQGVELFPLARRFSALADNPDTALELLEALVSHMEEVYQLIRAEQRISVAVPDAEIAADIWDLPDDIRPVPVVILVDEVAELALYASKDEEKRRDRIITALVRLAQLGRAAGIYLEICGQRFGSELGKGITMLRAQLTGRTAHRVNDETSANMAFGDISPDAVLAAIQIPAETRGIAIAGDSTGGWHRIRAPHTSLRQAVNICIKYADRTPDVPALAAYRPAVAALPSARVPLSKTAPATA
ncbi:FtsK/SpoIIIE domain-containing protein [Streptomyces iakyrus]|uniref:FtsK/SpoIIIE domain-containing protein n=1 Tax=Streptomyces iakyrus TaxID=68219 RepID=UPI000525096D|nr:FtsK/SpoIIIE domain-containing protein [Streptomyces iakyrus]